MVRRILTSSDDWLKDIPELSSSNEIKISPMVSGAIPVTVSGNSGVKVSGLFDPSFNLKVDGDLVVVKNLTIIKNESTSNITSSQNTFHTNTTINVTSIIDTVNSSDHSPEEKEMITKMLEYFQKIVNTKPLPEVENDIKTKFKEGFKMASPFIQQGLELWAKAAFG